MTSKYQSIKIYVHIICNYGKKGREYGCRNSAVFNYNDEAEMTYG